MQLFDESGEEFQGDDTKCRVTIIDDDKPGIISFNEKKKVTCPATDKLAKILINRTKGSDGKVTVDYETKELGNSGDAIDGVDFNMTKGTLVFQHGETEKVVEVGIVARDEDGEARNEMFGL